jgi:predicted phosphodiesterase
MADPGKEITLLGLSDEVVPLVDSPQIAETFQAADLIVSCGDLPSTYLEYALTALNKPLYYVPGNHDADDYAVPGGDNLDGSLRRWKSWWMLGFGGSMRYKKKGRHQYTQTEMAARVLPFLPRLFLRRLRKGRGLDLVVTHAPPKGIHDLSDPAHKGFSIFLLMIRLLKPRVLVHGHTHVHANLETVKTNFSGCTIINVFPYRVLSIRQ